MSAQLLARFPFGMLSLALLLHVERTHHSYAAAGLVLAATSIGQAIAGPLTSRWMGVWGMRRVLSLTTVVCAAGLVAIAFVHLPVPLIMVDRLPRRAQHPAGAAGGAHDLPEDGELDPADAAVRAGCVCAGDHLGRRPRHHDLRRHPGEHRSGHPARGRLPDRRRRLVRVLPRGWAACASRAANARSARCSPDRPCCSRRSSDSCWSAPARRSRRQ